MTDRLKGLGATLIIAMLVGGLPAGLLAVGVPTLFTRPIGNPLDLLLRPDDGSLVLAVIWILGWITWAILTVATLTEIVAALRRVRAPHLSGLRLPQGLAHQLVSTAALLFVATGTLAPTAAHAAPSSTVSVTVDDQHAVAQRTTTAPSATELNSIATTTYTVQPGDSLWRIAQQQLGAGERFTEIVDLNQQLLGGRPDFLRPGWILTLPGDSTTTQAPTDITVAKGDTLSTLAATHLGDASRWPEIHAASTSITQPDGRRLTDPDQIDVGWTLRLPNDAAAATPDAQSAIPDSASGVVSGVAKEALQEGDRSDAPIPTATATPSTDKTDEGANEAAPHFEGADREAEAAAEETPQAAGWLVPGLAGGGLLLGSLALVLARRRAIQASYRRPGKAVPAAPPELAPIEKTIVTHPAAVASTQTLERVLNWTAAQHLSAGQSVPPLVAVDMDTDRITLHLAEEDSLAEPWLADATGKHWTLHLAAIADIDLAAHDVWAAAWPQLVTMGTSDTGATWLINAEEVGTLRLTGDPAYAGDFARYLVAELALNPWARDVRIDCINTCTELTGLDPNKVRHHTTDAPIAAALVDALNTIDRLASVDVPDLGDARAGDAGDDLWGSRAVIVADTASPDLTVLLDTIAAQVGRTGTSVILTTDSGLTHGIEVHLTADGRVQLPAVGLDLVAVGLTPDEAAGCAALLAVADQPSDVDIPPMEIHPGEDSWRTYANEAGQVTDPRIVGRLDGADSILPDEDATLIRTAAVTIEDLETLAPTIPVDVATEVEHSDPTLDADLAEWHSSGPRPRLSVLGPILAKTGAGGNPQAATRRKPYYTELLAYLASRPHGATTDQIAEAMGIAPQRVRADMSVLRDWLGTNPAGDLHVPEANKSNAARLLGSNAYEVNDLLYDADLFRRLRVRGEARGARGLDDLKRALQLVHGKPCDQVRNGGGAWLVEQGLPHFLTVAIVDVAHMVSTRSLARGDHRDARAAAEIAMLAAPHEQIPRLDLAAVAAAEGLHQEANLIARAAIDGDGDEAPVELSRRADEILTRHRWLNDVQTG